MLRFFALLIAALTLGAADRWVEFRSGPFEVITDAGERAGRERLLQLEQFRFGIEQVLGSTDLKPARPIRILVSRPEANGPPSRPFLRECARILLQSMPDRLPAEVESGLAELFSTLEFKGSQVLLGAPLPPVERNLNWARMHMLTVPDDNFGKLRVLAHNLEQGADPGPAYRNAFGKSPAEIDKDAEAYLRAGNFAITQLRKKPIDPQREFAAMPVDAARLAEFKAEPPLAAVADISRKARPVRVSPAELAAAEKQRQAEQKQRELEEVKQKSMASIQAALDKANQEHPATPPSSGKVVPWWDGPQAKGKAQGVLRQVDCLGKQARLVIEGDDKKLTRLLIPDPTQVVIEGGGEKTFGCGPQRPARRIVVEYFPKPDAKLGTAGEAAVIQFP